MSVLLSDRHRLPATVVDYARRLEFTCPPMIANVVDVAALKVEGEGFPALAPGIGLVRLVEEAADARWVTDLISHVSPAAP